MEVPLTQAKWPCLYNNDIPGLQPQPYVTQAGD